MSRRIPPPPPDGTEPLFQGLTGSHAYGMAVPGSDEDWRGVFAYPTEKWLGLHDPNMTIEGEGDSTWWELRHWARMVEKGSVNAHELLWLPSRNIYFSSGLWDTLVSHRKGFFSKRLYDGWVGVANGYRHELERAGEEIGHYKLEGAERAKHAAHLLRFAYGLVGALSSGRIDVDLGITSTLLKIRSGAISVDEAIEGAERHLAIARGVWDEAQPWPPQPNSELLNSLVAGYRLQQLRQPC